jgi:hypothetical protein
MLVNQLFGKGTGKDDGRRAWFGNATPQPNHVVRNIIIPQNNTSDPRTTPATRSLALFIHTTELRLVPQIFYR